MICRVITFFTWLFGLLLIVFVVTVSYRMNHPQWKIGPPTPVHHVHPHVKPHLPEVA